MDTTQRQANTKVTPEMIKQAALYLEESGLVEHWPGPPADLIVKGMLERAADAV